MLLLITVYQSCIPSLREAVFWPTAEAWLNWGEYIKLAIPSIMVALAEQLPIEGLVIMAGLVNSTEQAANVIIVQLLLVTFTMTSGIVDASCTVIGNSIGGNKVG